MQSLIHADIFFFVSTVVLVVVAAGIVVALVYVIKILRNVSEVSDKVRDESTEILSDIKSLRTDLRRQGFGFQYVWQFISKLFTRSRTRTKK